MKPTERQQAIALRRRGKSVKTIARTLGVSTSSVSRWVREVALTDAQSTELRKWNPASLAGSRALQRNARERRARFQQEGRDAARAGNPLFIAGAMLYWGEGGKDPNVVRLSNADPDLIRFFVRFLREACGVPNEQIRLTAHCHTDVRSVAEIEAYWSRVTGLPPTNFTKSIVNHVSRASRGKRRGLLPYGTLRVCVCRTDVLHRIYGAIQELGDFDSAEWLNGARRAQA